MNCPEFFTHKTAYSEGGASAGDRASALPSRLSRALRQGLAVAGALTLAAGVGLPGAGIAPLEAQEVSSGPGADLDRAQQMLRRGSYDAAIELFSRSRGPDYVDGVLGASRAYALSGRPQQAIDLCREAISNAGGVAEIPRVSTQLAELQREQGNSGEALEILETVVSESREAPLRALVQYGDLLELRGRRQEGREYFYQAIERYDRGLVFESSDVAMVALASWKLGRFHDANTLFSEAVRTDPENLEAQVLWGDLFLEKSNPTDAEKSYSDALEVNRNYVPALVGMARINGGERALERALSINPRSVAALETYGELLLKNRREEEAEDYLRQALSLNAESVDALAMLAAIAALDEEEAVYRDLEQQVQAFSPGNARFYGVIAETLGSNYLFEEAVGFARRAVEADPEYWHGHTVLGNNLVRLGEEEEGRRHLELAFDNDPFDVMTSNLLQVFDTLDDYVLRESEHFQVRMSQDDALVLWPYLEPLLEEGWDRLTAKYEFEPEGRVLIEIFDTTEDFAVRSVGLPDIGPLVGICFGKVITLISPDTLSANWQEIVWHEFVHVITLQMTDNRIPRWLSEGVSVWEEQEARPYWGRRQGLELARAVKEDKLLPVGRLDAGFLGAQSNADLGFAYFQSYLVVDYIASELGFDRLLELIRAYAEPADEEEIFRSVFDQSLDDFDAGFRAWVDRRVEEINVYVHQEDMPDEGSGHGHGMRSNSSAVLAELYNNASLKQHMRQRIQSQPRDFQAHLQLGIVLFKEESFGEAERHLRQAHEILPDYTGYPSPPLVLSQIYEQRGDRERQVEQLKLLLENQQHDYESAMILAEAALEEDDLDQAGYYLERALAVDPYRVEVHRLGAELAERLSQPAMAVREHEVLVQLDDNDPVEAHTRLARAYLDNGQREQARRNILLALEIAPGYRDAQRVLLEAVGEDE